jgi:CHAT domain-containing protein/tetratricopeptide (TPR) repeat protein
MTRQDRFTPSSLGARLLLGLAFCVPAPLAAADPPPAGRTAAATDGASREARLTERDRLWNEARQLRGQGKLAAAIDTGRKMLAIEREVLADDSPAIIQSLRWLGDVAEEAEDWDAAKTWRKQSLEWLIENRGENHWETVDARLLNADAERWSQLGDEDARFAVDADRQLRRAEQLVEASDFPAAHRIAQEVRPKIVVIFGETHRLTAKSYVIAGRCLSENGNHAAARLENERALELQEKLTGSKHPTFALILNNLAWATENLPDSDQAESLLKRALETRREVLGAAHANTIFSLKRLARFYDKQGKSEEAEPLLRQLVAIRKASADEQPQQYADSLDDLALLYWNIGDYARAEPLSVEALKIRKEVLGDKHPAYATSLNNLAALYSTIGDYARAEPLLVEALKIRKEVPGEKHPEYATSLNNLAGLYLDMGNCARAQPLYVEALKIRKEALGEKHPDYAASLNNLALLSRSMGDYARAEPLYVEARAIYKEALGEKHPDYATSLNGLAALYSTMGDYARAEPLCVEALKIKKEVLGEKHPAYATSLNNLALLYRSMGDYVRAEPLYVEDLKITKEVLGEKHPDYAKSLNGLAALYSTMGDYARAEPLCVEALKIKKEVLGEKHPAYATSLNNLALLYQSMGDHVRAEPLYVEDLKIIKEVLGEKHPSFATSLNNLALLYDDLGEYARAEPLYVQARAILREVLEEKHPDYAQSLINLASLYAAMNRPAEAEPLYRQALGISRASLEATSVIQSERQQLAMGQSLRHQLDAYVSLGLNTGRYTASVFRQVLTWKGATLVRQRGMRLAGDDPAVRDLFTQLQRTAAQLASLSRAVPGAEAERAGWRTRLSDLTHEQERLEAELSAKSAAFRQATREVTLEDLLASLPQDTVLIDYLEFQRSTPPKAKGEKTSWERQLAAFVVRHAERPEERVTMISLGPVAPLSAAIDAWRKTFGMDRAGAAAGRTLRAAVWEPVLTHLGNVKTILVSTDGVLGRLPLGALPGKEPGTYLLEDHRLAVLPVPQLLPTLVNAEGKRELSKELLLLGDVDYDALPGGAGPKQRRPRRPGESRSPTDSKLFEPLDGAAGEIAAIEKLYAGLFGAQTDDPFSLTKRQADETRFRELAPQYRHLHLATHGFFAGEQYVSALESRSAAEHRDRAMLANRELPVTGYHPGLLSGLALAGANMEPTSAADDGLLTAREIGVMNLSGVDTVVLSACDTGLGETAGGEGLLGVQRAFQTAGARMTVASFWKVDDLVTRFLMERFYRNLWEKEMPRLDALREAQLYVLNHPEKIRGSDAPQEAEPRTSPRFWAAFTLSGDWR